MNDPIPTGSMPKSAKSDSTIMVSGISSYPDETELDLGLGLTLGCAGSGASSSFHYARILTAMDFPSHMSSSSSSSCSTPDSINKASNVSVGTKRNADSLVATANVSQAVGWPPVGAYRMNSFTNQTKSQSPEEFNSTTEKSTTKNTAVLEKPSNGSEKNNKKAVENENLRISSFVKVNKDGIPIGRKVDLHAHSCYETLARTLEDMFSKPPAVDAMRTSEEERNTKVEARRSSKLLDGSSEFVLTYEDKDGDLMLVGDVPWGLFLNSVKRLRIMRASDANGLAPRLQEMTRRRRSNPI